MIWYDNPELVWFLRFKPCLIIFDSLVQDCSISIANAMEILQSCAKSSICVPICPAAHLRTWTVHTDESQWPYEKTRSDTRQTKTQKNLIEYCLLDLEGCFQIGKAQIASLDISYVMSIYGPRLPYLPCLSNGDTPVLHRAIYTIFQMEKITYDFLFWFDIVVVMVFK